MTCSTARLEDQSVTDEPPSFSHKKKSLSMSKQIPVTDLNDCLLLVTFFSVSHSRAVLTRMRLWPPLWSTRRQQAPLIKMETCVFCFKKNIFQDIPHASNWLATILGAFFSSRPTMRIFLSVHPCEAHFESQSLQASVDTFDSESGSLDLLNIFRRRSNVVVL